MKRIVGFLFFFSVLVGAAATAQTKSSANIMQVVTASPAIAADVILASSLNPAVVGKTITYSGTVTGSNNGASPTGTITVVGLTGTQTVALDATGKYTCSETPTVATSAKGTQVTATFNSADGNFF